MIGSTVESGNDIVSWSGILVSALSNCVTELVGVSCGVVVSNDNEVIIIAEVIIEDDVTVMNDSEVMLLSDSSTITLDDCVTVLLGDSIIITLVSSTKIPLLGCTLILLGDRVTDKIVEKAVSGEDNEICTLGGCILVAIDVLDG